MISLFRKCKAAEDRILSWRHARRTCKTLATPNTSQPINLFKSNRKYVRMLPYELVLTTNEILGEGQFGICKKGFLQGMNVCVKMMKSSDETSKQGLIAREANVLSMLSHSSLCFFHGVIVKDGMSTALVTSLYTVNNFVVTLRDLISDDSNLDSSISSLRSTLDSKRWVTILREVVDGVNFIHGKLIIHRDIKTDNIVFYDQCSVEDIRPVIIDFGKALSVGYAKKYELSDTQKSYYRTHHRHIAPDLIDGINAPSLASDMYSYGRLFKCIIETFPIPVDHLPKAAMSAIKNCLKYNSHERPTAETVFTSLK